MNLLVTGGAGFIGAHLCKYFVDKGHKIVCIDNFDEFYPKNIKKDNIKDLKENSKFQLITSDVRDTDTLIDIFFSKRIEAVVHLAAKSGPSLSFKNPTEYININVNGTISLLEAMKEADVNKLVFASTSSVYGIENPTPYIEDMVPGTPGNPYAASKQATENIIQMYHHLFDLSAVVLRIFSVYGPRQRPDSGMFQFVKSNLKKQPVTVYSEGKQLRDYTHVNDIVQAISLSIDYLLRPGASPEHTVFNIASGKPASVNEILEIIESHTKNKFDIQYKKPPIGNITAMVGDIGKARDLLGYTPTGDLHAGIGEFITWLIDNDLQ
ncbi:MAG: SDR family NAD(P)-dependent oxidoreductase [Cytophagales bacterium]|nr:SDR family NAD(P)-dependent oxidoreductase [Cytophagales bacterium]